MAAKVGAKVKRLLDRQVGKVLITEGDHLPFGHQARQLVFTGIGQRAKLDTAHLGADRRRQVRDHGLVLGQQVRERRVGVLAVVVVLKRL